MLAFWFLCWIFGLVLAGSFWSASSVHFNVYCSIRSNIFSVNRSDCCSNSSNSFEAGWWWLRGFFCSRLVLADLEKFTNCGSGLPPLRIFFLRKKHFFSYIRIFCARHVHSSTNIIVWPISALSIALGIILNQTFRAIFSRMFPVFGWRQLPIEQRTFLPTALTPLYCFRVLTRFFDAFFELWCRGTDLYNCCLSKFSELVKNLSLLISVSFFLVNVQNVFQVLLVPPEVCVVSCYRRVSLMYCFCPIAWNTVFFYRLNCFL